MNYSKQIKSIFDLSGKNPEVAELTAMVGDYIQQKKKEPKPKKGTRAYMQSVPWKYDYNNHCVKCNRVYHLQKHHITYTPSLTVFLCEKCHSKITGMNTRAARIVGTSKKYNLFF